MESALAIGMENVAEKLKLLNYEKLFCEKKKPRWKPVHRLYFAIPLKSNPSEQFQYFSNLVTWLLGLCGKSGNAPSQYDDPNVVCTNIVVELKDLGYSQQMNFPPAKLKQGYGDAVCTILRLLVNHALQSTKFSFQKPVYPAENYSEEAEYDEGADLGGVAEDIAGYSDNEEEMYQGGERSAEQGVIDDNAMIESTINPADWKLELERVTPQLRTMVLPGSKDWRSHLEKAKQSLETIRKSLPESKKGLERIDQDLGGTLERLTSREDYVNSHFDLQVREYRAFREQLTMMQSQYHKSTENVAELANDLSRISEELEAVKQTKEDRENNISDTSPLVKMKQAISTVQMELTELNVRIGVVEHELLKTLQKASLERKLGKR